MKMLIGWLAALCLLAGCGSPDEGPELGDFPPITKKEGDEPFKLVAPSSKSPAAFTFDSSNQAVATIDGDMVTIKSAGQSTITAAQPSIGSFGPTRKTTTLTVTAVACATGQTRVNGSCTAIPTCIAPAIVIDNKCAAPISSGATVLFDGRSWMGVTNSDTWTRASEFCANTAIDGKRGWRQPTAAELSALFASGAISPTWVLGNTWTSEMGTNGTTAGRVAINLATGERTERGDATGAYVSCVL